MWLGVALLCVACVLAGVLIGYGAAMRRLPVILAAMSDAQLSELSERVEERQAA